MIKELLHKKIVENRSKVEDWFSEHRKGLSFPFYSSFDIRDSSFKVAPVDANIFPAGFNNICNTDQESSVDLAKNYLDDHYPKNSKKILLLTEEHTNNPYYWDNVATLHEIITKGGRDVRLAIPRALDQPLDLTSASGKTMRVYSARRDGGGINIEGWTPDLIISNNDFSEAYQDWVQGLETPINPPHDLGWHKRRKDHFFKAYNCLAGEFAEMLQIDPWHLQVETRLFSNFDVNDEANRESLAKEIDVMLEKQRVIQAKHDVKTPPFFFVKNNAGTYGLGVVQVHSGDDVRQWNYKSRKKMKAAKGGRDVEEVIIQEGVPTSVVGTSGVTAEPAIYMIGCRLAGGFLRTHKEKGPEESLNSPGAIYQKMCVSDLEVSIEGCPTENVYGWIARLSFLAIAQEAKTHNVVFKDYIASDKCRV